MTDSQYTPDQAAQACIADLLGRLQCARRQTAAALADAEVYRLGMLAALDALRAEQLRHGLARRHLLAARRETARQAVAA